MPTADTAVEAVAAHGLRSLYYIRAAFSVVWVVLVFVLAADVTNSNPPGAAAIVLLVIYPVWDAVATLLDLRASRPTSRLPQYLNIAFGIVTAVLLAVLLPTGGLAPGLVVFGCWAFVTGAVQLFLAIRRQRSIGRQWPMMISGGLSVIAGVAFAVMASAPGSGLGTLAGYSAFGAFWYLVVALLLVRRAPRTV